MRIHLLLPLLLAAALLQAQARRDYAVFFPVSDYAGGWSQLPSTRSECNDLAADLSSLYGFQTEVLPNKTKAGIKAKLVELAGRTYGPNDQLLLFFSMHGYFDETGEEGCLCPAGARTADPGFDTWLLHAELRTLAAKIPCEHILLVLDACYSGTFGGKKGGPSGPDYQQDSPDCQATIDKALRRKTRYYIASGAKERTPAVSEMVKKMRVALGGRYSGDDGVLALKELLAALSEANPAPKDGEFTGDLGGGFVFVPKNGCAAVPAASNDRDGDGVPNADDRCPDQYGPKANAGCPTGTAPNETADSDYDGVPDSRDACPNQYGTAKANGCPDRDNDGVPDISDKCPGAAGEVHWQGCPDSDGDGLPDHEDNCPDQKGTAADRGCPPPDRDGDGLVFVKGGTFQMGCTSEQQDCADDEEPAHTVTLSDFYIGRYEVTQRLWTEIMGSNPSSRKNCDDCPVENVSWNDVQDFLQRLNAKYPGRNYRLPTEAEWEYAARGGGRAVLFGNGKNVADPAEINFDGSAAYKKSYSAPGTYRKKTVPVGSLNSPNTLGLHDMSGNVNEWCADWYDSGYYKNSPSTNPTGPTSGPYRVLRGGSWNVYPQGCRVANRQDDLPSNRYNHTGFRLARSR